MAPRAASARGERDSRVFVEEYLVTLRRARFTPRAWMAYARLCFLRAHASAWESPDLARSVGVSALVVLAGALGWALLLSFTLSARLAHRFLVVQFAWLAILLAWQFLHLGLLRDADGRMPRRVPIATLITLARLVVLPGLMSLVLARQFAWATVAYVAATITDVLDGVVARAMHQITRLGTVLDMLADQALAVAVFLAMARMELAPWYLCGIVVARCALLIGGALYILLCFGPITIRPTAFGKTSGVIGTVLTSLLLAAPALFPLAAARHVRDLTSLTLAGLNVANMVQAVLIGMVNLRRARLPRPVPVPVASPEHHVRPAS